MCKSFSNFYHISHLADPSLGSSCAAPPQGAVSIKQQRERYRKVLLNAFDAYFHPDYAIPSEFKEAFPAGRFRPLCKIQAKRGATASVVAESIKAPEWWSSSKVIQAFDAVLQDKVCLVYSLGSTPATHDDPLVFRTKSRHCLGESAHLAW